MREVNSGKVIFLGKDVTNEVIDEILGLDYEDDYDMVRDTFYITKQ